MIGLGIAAAYALLAFYFWRRFAWRLDQDSYTDHGEAIVMGGFLATIWPIAALVMAVMTWEGFMLAPRSVRQKEKIKELEQRNAQLERDLGLAEPKRDPRALGEEVWLGGGHIYR
jgi:membrane protein implicated in regulation of membrane protease activity